MSVVAELLKKKDKFMCKTPEVGRCPRLRLWVGAIVRASVVPSLDIFFFQAEDGIRDYKVTGVQTCALPILQHADNDVHRQDRGEDQPRLARERGLEGACS